MMNPLITLSFHGTQCENQSQQDSHLTDALFLGDMLFAHNNDNEQHVKNYGLHGAVPDHFCVRNAVLDNHFHSSQKGAAIYI
ncbi:hypothetical protein [Pantoea agglomerans]|uniref:hypothetical protein n=1 Tax=Enterobacter agglomerans TaxID=549 RepID=UPI001F1D9472|nr:hypothetical protein [Pantoea agglomerans]